MQIESPCVVTLTWILSDAQSRPIDRLDEATDFYFGGDDLLARVEDALAGHVAGEKVQVQLEPEHAFGDYRAELVCFEPRRLFPQTLEAGMTFEGLPPGSTTPDMPTDAIYVVTEVYADHVVLDGNHPLAGMALRLEMLVRRVREATPDETEARSIGGEATVLAGAGAPPPPPPPSALH